MSESPTTNGEASGTHMIDTWMAGYKAGKEANTIASQDKDAFKLCWHGCLDEGIECAYPDCLSEEP